MLVSCSFLPMMIAVITVDRGQFRVLGAGRPLRRPPMRMGDIDLSRTPHSNILSKLRSPVERGRRNVIQFT